MCILIIIKVLRVSLFNVHYINGKCESYGLTLLQCLDQLLVFHLKGRLKSKCDNGHASQGNSLVRCFSIAV